jgi:hypothetical protein
MPREVSVRWLCSEEDSKKHSEMSAGEDSFPGFSMSLFLYFLDVLQWEFTPLITRYKSIPVNIPLLDIG